MAGVRKGLVPHSRISSAAGLLNDFLQLPRRLSIVSSAGPASTSGGSRDGEEAARDAPAGDDGATSADSGGFHGEEAGRPPREGPTFLQLGMAMTGIAIACKLMMMYDETQEPARIARRARHLAEAQERLKPLSQGEWAALQSIRPQTPFDSAAARDGASIRAGGRHTLADYRDWGADVLTDAMWRQELAIRRSGGGQG